MPESSSPVRLLVRLVVRDACPEDIGELD